MPNKKETNIQCRRCKHSWNTASQLTMVTCPNCLNKTVNPNNSYDITVKQRGSNGKKPYKGD